MDHAILSLFDNPTTVPTPNPTSQAWLATDKGTGRQMMIKRLTSMTIKGRATDALALDHPAILRTRRWYVFEGALWVVRDAMRGRNLRQHLVASGGRPDVAGLRRLMAPVMDALGYAHGRDVAHAGISYENILVGEDGTVRLSDFGATDPGSPVHTPLYNGRATPDNDVRAMGKLMAALLPVSGPFANPVVRSRIEGTALRSTRLDELKDIVDNLESLAHAPVVRTTSGNDGPTGIPHPQDDDPFRPLEASVTAPITQRGYPAIAFRQVERPMIAQGAGGNISGEVRNTGEATLLIRMIGAQHPWLNPRPTTLPLVLAPGASAKLVFAVSAARLAPGEYRSEVFFSTNVPGRQAEGTAGWFRHGFEVRARVVRSGADW